MHITRVIQETFFMIKNNDKTRITGVQLNRITLCVTEGTIKFCAVIFLVNAARKTTPTTTLFTAVCVNFDGKKKKEECHSEYLGLLLR